MVGEFCIGVLALQGAFLKHQEQLAALGVKTVEVRVPSDLDCCRGLILPGGESTVMTKLIHSNNLLKPLLQFSALFPIFGTCAGMILMSREGILDLIDITVVRNAYGRQKSSFFTELTLDLPEPAKMEAFFIRAPQIKSLHSNEISILAKVGEVPVLVQQGRHLACAFHPELTKDLTLHRYFVQICTYDKIIH